MRKRPATPISSVESEPEARVDRRSRAKDDKRRRLRAAAEALFRERGFEGTTIRDVATRADLGVGTVYTYVRDKHALLEWISEQDLSSVEEEAFRTLPKKGGIEAELRHVFSLVYAHHAKDPELARVIVKELSFARDATTTARDERFARFFGKLALRVEAAKARGEIDATLDAVEVAAHVFGLHFYVLVLWLKGALPAPDAPFARSLALALRGLRPPTHATPPPTNTREKRGRRTP